MVLKGVEGELRPPTVWVAFDQTPSMSRIESTGQWSRIERTVSAL